MSPVVGVIDTATLEAVSGAVGVIEVQLDTMHTMVQSATSAILPPTNDSASATATAQQMGNVQEFAAALRLGLMEIRKATEVIKATNASYQIADAAGAAAAAAV